MATDADPVVGNWYRHLDKGQRFEVVAVDEAAGVVEVQHFDGDVEEIEIGNWFDQEIEPIESPENWTGPFDDVETDALDYTETDMKDEDWKAPYDELEQSEAVEGRHGGKGEAGEEEE